jgi:hypothetical protein
MVTPVKFSSTRIHPGPAAYLFACRSSFHYAGEFGLSREYAYELRREESETSSDSSAASCDSPELAARCMT